jgi:hypothetical protein
MRKGFVKLDASTANQPSGLFVRELPWMARLSSVLESSAAATDRSAHRRDEVA